MDQNDVRRPRILLTGGSGLLGSELRRIDPSIDAPTSDQLDIRDIERTAACMAELAPDIVIHAAAETDNRKIEADPRGALAVNISGTANIASACLGRRIRLVYVSTDYVYEGVSGDYRESDCVKPVNLYAWTKLAGEAAVRAVPNHLIIRTSFGPSRFEHAVAFTDKFASKDYVDRIAPHILELATGPLTGIVNIGGSRRTIFEYARERNPDVAGISLHDSGGTSPPDSSLNLDKWHRYRTGRGEVRPVQNCRICGDSRLETYLDLGMMPLANNLAASAHEAKSMARYPMQVRFCHGCSLSQLSAVVDPRLMFSHYTYRSAMSKGYVRHCRQMARHAGSMLELVSSDLVVDIAGNDGTLLAEFRDELGVRVLNVDPARNICAIAEDRGITSLNEFWSASIAERITADFGRAKLITATNVFAHVDDVRGFVDAARTCLLPDGVLMLEFPYAVDFIEHREFDTVYFEHLSYVLISPVVQLASALGMDVIRIEKQEIHGGSVRVFIAPEGSRPVGDTVGRYLDSERSGGFLKVRKYRAWREEVDALIEDLRKRLSALCTNGARIAAFGASAKGNTLLNACQLDSRTIEYIVDDTPEKIGRYSPGTGIPVVDRRHLAAHPPDFLLILAWNFAAEIMDGMRDFDGKYIVPIPGFRIVGTE